MLDRTSDFASYERIVNYQILEMTKADEVVRFRAREKIRRR